MKRNGRTKYILKLSLKIIKRIHLHHRRIIYKASALKTIFLRRFYNFVS